jgi:two-component system response regulator HydG
MNGPEALTEITKSFFDIVVVDKRVSSGDGLKVLKQIKKLSPSIPILFIDPSPSLDEAIDAFRAGALDYLIWPRDVDVLTRKITEYFQRRTEGRQEDFNISALQKLCDASLLVCQSPEMEQVLHTIAVAGPTDGSVLIIGESGTQKDLIAEAIHKASTRVTKPFVKVNCAALSDAVLEMELFGQEKGVGSGIRRSGKFQVADGGTLFLEEISETTRATQSKLLRSIRDGQIEPLGSKHSTKIDVRIIASSTKDLKDEVQRGAFTRNLFHSLNVVPIRVPSLRQRPQDLKPLVSHFLKIYNERNGRNLAGFHPAAMEALTKYSWPGNVRELQSVVERTVILTTTDYAQLSDLPATIREAEDRTDSDLTGGIRPGLTLAEMEKLLILRTLEDHDGNRTQTARVLGITRRTLQLKIKEYGIVDENRFEND